jgi:sugar/nucleoside kinase (ribokinase family)
LLTLLNQVDIFLLDEKEARAITGEDDTGTALRQLAKHARQVVVKCGVGEAITLRNGRIVSSPGFLVKVTDTTGAGDSSDAGFIYAAVIQGMSLTEALRFANACGALVTTGLSGTAAQPTREQVVRFLQEHNAR